MLTAMTREGRDYAEVLAEAQAKGYAEADPTADVEGLDALNKLVILARLAFGAWIDPSSVANRPGSTTGAPGLPGITGVTAADVEALRAEGRVLRLIATSRLAEDGAIEASVVPTAVPAESPFGRCDGVLNRIEVDADPVGRVAFEGPGAGGPAAAAAVLSRPRRRSPAASARRGPAAPPRRRCPGSRSGRSPASASRRPRAPATRSGTEAPVTARPRPVPGSSSATARSCPSATRRRS